MKITKIIKIVLLIIALLDVEFFAIYNIYREFAEFGCRIIPIICFSSIAILGFVATGWLVEYCKGKED